MLFLTRPTAHDKKQDAVTIDNKASLQEQINTEYSQRVSADEALDLRVTALEGSPSSGLGVKKVMSIAATF